MSYFYDVRKAILYGVSARGLRGVNVIDAKAFKPLKGCTKATSTGLRFRVDGQKFKGWCVVLGGLINETHFEVVFHKHGGCWEKVAHFTDINPGQLTSVIDAFVDDVDSEIGVANE